MITQVCMDLYKDDLSGIRKPPLFIIHRYALSERIIPDNPVAREMAARILCESLVVGDWIGVTWRRLRNTVSLNLAYAQQQKTKLGRPGGDTVYDILSGMSQKPSQGTTSPHDALPLSVLYDHQEGVALDSTIVDALMVLLKQKLIYRRMVGDTENKMSVFFPSPSLVELVTAKPRREAL